MMYVPFCHNMYVVVASWIHRSWDHNSSQSVFSLMRLPSAFYLVSAVINSSSSSREARGDR